jgi:hypothetical protein
MMIINLCFSLFSFLMLYQEVKQEHIVVIGQTKNAKGGAIVVSKDNGVYYLEGIDSWNEEIYDKRVKVSGILKIENLKRSKQKPGIPMRAEMVGIKRTILKPQWELIK